MTVLHPRFQLSGQILSLLARVAEKQGALNTMKLHVQDVSYIYRLANVDAVHFSTKLEGNLLTHEEVTRALNKKGLQTGRDIKEVLNYGKARAFLFAQASKQIRYSESLLLETHKLLLKGIVVGKLLGNFRQAQNVIQDSRDLSIVYMPPMPDDVPDLMDALNRWCYRSSREDISVFIIAAMFHYYLVTIHPFMDGNGRTARVLANFWLQSNECDVARYAAIEKQHEANRNAYYTALRTLQAPTYYDIPADIDLTPWLQYWLSCLNATYDEALDRCRTRQADPMLDKVTLNQRLQYARQLFKKHRELRAIDYQLLTGVERTQAVADLNQLERIKLIRRIGGGRSTKYTAA